MKHLANAATEARTSTNWTAIIAAMAVITHFMGFYPIATAMIVLTLILAVLNAINVHVLQRDLNLANQPEDGL